MEKLKAHLKTIGTMISTIIGGLALIFVIVISKHQTELLSLIILVVVTYIFADWYKALYRSFRRK